MPFNKGEDLLWGDYEVKLLDQAVRTMESYVSQFPDVKVRQEEASKQKLIHKHTHTQIKGLRANAQKPTKTHK